MKLSLFLDDKSKWCQGNFATNAHGMPVDPLDLKAISWCIEGAMVVCRYTLAEGANVLADIYRKTGSATHIWQDNPGRTFDEVRKLLLDIGH